MIRVVAVDDQELIRTAVSALIANEADLELVGIASNGFEAIEAAHSLRPDVVLMDIRMPQLDGLEATRHICADPELSGVRVLMLTTFEEEEYIFQALRDGASGFIGKGANGIDLMGAIRIVHRGDALLSPIATRRLIDNYARALSPRKDPEVATALALLTERENQILALIARGCSNDEISAQLFISPHTTKTHVNRTMTKLAVHDRAQLVVLAYEGGLVVPGDR